MMFALTLNVVTYAYWSLGARIHFSLSIAIWGFNLKVLNVIRQSGKAYGITEVNYLYLISLF
jgi:hypothetical protein